jgi:CubicO group peptidase (beta-lactamase class C family)
MVLKSDSSFQTMQVTRRSALGLLAGASATAAGGGALGINNAAGASDRDDDWRHHSHEVPRDLLPGGSYDQFLSEQAAQDQFSGNVLLAHRGRPVLTRSYGLASKEKNLPIRPDTLFLLASVTKTLTATAVLQLVANGQIALDGTLGMYLSGFPADIANTVTVHHLLTMTSGMADYSQVPAWFPESKTWSTPIQALEGTMSFITSAPLLFTPGSAYSYSNSGFVVLGAIVAQVSAQHYWDYMRQNIFAAAGMTQTDFYTTAQVLAMMGDGRMANNYAQQRGGPRVNLLSFGPPQFIGLPDGAGGPYTTASDLLAFAMALQNGTLLRPDYVRLMLNGKVPLFPRPTPFDPAIQLYFSGYGLTDTLINDTHILSHAGEGPGSTTNLDIYPTEDWVAIVLENYDLQPFGLVPDVCPLVKLERQLITSGR